MFADLGLLSRLFPWKTLSICCSRNGIALQNLTRPERLTRSAWTHASEVRLLFHLERKISAPSEKKCLSAVSWIRKHISSGFIPPAPAAPALTEEGIRWIDRSYKKKQKNNASCTVGILTYNYIYFICRRLKNLSRLIEEKKTNKLTFFGKQQEGDDRVSASKLIFFIQTQFFMSVGRPITPCCFAHIPSAPTQCMLKDTHVPWTCFSNAKNQLTPFAFCCLS